MPIIIRTTWADVDVFIYTKQYDNQPEGGDNVSATATVAYLVDYQNRWRFVREVMGTPQLLDFANPTQLLYRLPLQYSDNPALYAQSFNITPVGVSDNCSFTFEPETVYPYAWVEINYGTLKYDPATSYTIEVKCGTQEITAPDYTYSFASDGKVIDEPVAVKVVNQEIQITFPRVPLFKPAAYVGYVGCVNLTEFMGFAAGTVLMNPVTSRYSGGIGTGSPIWEVVLSFTWRNIEWNKFLRSDGTWDDVTPTPFATAELNDLTS